MCFEPNTCAATHTSLTPQRPGKDPGQLQSSVSYGATIWAELERKVLSWVQEASVLPTLPRTWLVGGCALAQLGLLRERVIGASAPEDVHTRLPATVPVSMLCRNHLGANKGPKEVTGVLIPISQMWKPRLTVLRALSALWNRHRLQDTCVITSWCIVTLASCVKRTTEAKSIDTHRHEHVLDTGGLRAPLCKPGLPWLGPGRGGTLELFCRLTVYA